MDDNEVDQMKKLLEIHRFNLDYNLKRQQILRLHTPEHIMYAIQEDRKEIQKLKRILKSRNVQVEDLALEAIETEHTLLPNLQRGSKIRQSAQALKGILNSKLGSGVIIVYTNYSHYKEKQIRAHLLSGEENIKKTYYAVFTEYEEGLMRRFIAAAFVNLPLGRYKVEDHWLALKTTRFVEVKERKSIIEIEFN